METMLPQYRCHKQVGAVKILSIRHLDDGSATLEAESDIGTVTFDVNPGWLHCFRGDDSDLGYFVRYADGYQSWSPTAAFESGYTKI